MAKRLSVKQNLIDLASDFILGVDEETQVRCYLGYEARAAATKTSALRDIKKAGDDDKGKENDGSSENDPSPDAEEEFADPENRELAIQLRKTIRNCLLRKKWTPELRLVTHVRNLPEGWDISAYNFEEHYRKQTLWNFPWRYMSRPAHTSWTAYYRKLNLASLTKKSKPIARQLRRSFGFRKSRGRGGVSRRVARKPTVVTNVDLNNPSDEPVLPDLPDEAAAPPARRRGRKPGWKLVRGLIQPTRRSERIRAPEAAASGSGTGQLPEKECDSNAPRSLGVPALRPGASNDTDATVQGPVTPPLSSSSPSPATTSQGSNSAAIGKMDAQDHDPVPATFRVPKARISSTFWANRHKYLH